MSPKRQMHLQGRLRLSGWPYFASLKQGSCLMKLLCTWSSDAHISTVHGAIFTSASEPGFGAFQVRSVRFLLGAPPQQNTPPTRPALSFLLTQTPISPRRDAGAANPAPQPIASQQAGQHYQKPPNGPIKDFMSNQISVILHI